MLNVILIRHGEEEKIKEKEIEYQVDNSPLTKEGIRQVKDLLTKLKNFKIDKIYSSNIKRALQTSEIINEEINTEIEIDKRLRERNIGEFEKFGNKWREEFKKLKEKELTRGISLKNIKPPGGESLHEFRERIKSFLQDISKKEGNVLISAHRGVNTAIINFLLDWDCLEFKPIPQDYACINLLSFNKGKWKILSINKK